MRTLVATALLVLRIGVLALGTVSLACVTGTRDATNYTAFRFLEAVLCLQLPWSFSRLVFDTIVTIFHAPLPDRHDSLVIVVVEWVLSCLTYATGASTLAVQVYFEKNMAMCAFLPPGDCHRYKAAALLALSASLFTTTVSLLQFFVWARGYDEG